MERIGIRFHNFWSAVEEVNDINEVLAIFALHLHEEEGVSGQTVEQYLCNLHNELRIQGYVMDEFRLGLLKKAMRRRSTETRRANPMTLSILETICQNSRLSLEERVFLQLIWLSLQRPGDLKNQLRKDSYLYSREADTMLAIWMRQGTKNTTREEHGTPRVIRMVIPKHWVAGFRALFAQKTEGLFAKIRMLTMYDELKKIEPPLKHDKLRDKFTLYSVRRGAMQHLAAHHVSLADIRALSRHAQDASLRAYIGGLLDPQAIRGEEVSRNLSVPIHVPPEFANALLEIDEEEEAVIEPSQPTPPSRRPLTPVRPTSPTPRGRLATRLLTPQLPQVVRRLDLASPLGPWWQSRVLRRTGGQRAPTSPDQ